jgi:NarL family two-component system response regulator LiaR
MPNAKPIRVMLVDDHPIVRDGLKNMLLAFDDLALAGEAENGRAALQACLELLPDVILMDILMPEMDGIQATRAILERCPQVKIIILTSYPEDNLVQQALQAGASGYLLKNAAIDALAGAVRFAYAGQTALAPEARRALGRREADEGRPGSTLSNREKQVLALVAEGLSNEEIAARLVISPATARHHVSACIQKLGAANRAQAAALAIKNNLV